MIHVVLIRFSEDPDILRELVHLEEDLGEDGGKVDPLTYVRREIWDMLYADDAGIVSKSAKGLAKMMTVIVTVFEAAGSPYSKRNGDHAAADTESDTPDLTARHRSSNPDI